MPKLTKHLPSYCKHKASGQAVVTLAGRDYYLGPYLGPHGTTTSKAAYERLVARWLSGDLANTDTDLTIGELAAKYWVFVRGHYVKNGRPTSEQTSIRYALRPLLALYENEPADSFGPKALKAVMDRMIEVGQCRSTINMNTGRIRRMFKWAISEELLKIEVYQRLCSVTGLQRGRTAAVERHPIEPVSDEHVEAVLPQLPQTVADMVRFQRLVGCRPNEVCQLRPADIDRSRDVWRYTPQSHKTEHRGRQRIILIGPKAQAILLRYLARDPVMYCFRPCDSEAKRRADKHAARKTSMSCGNRPGSNRKGAPRRQPSDRYSTGSYARAVERGCDLAFPLPPEVRRAKGETMPQWRQRIKVFGRDVVVGHYKKYRWSPNRLRHAAATEIRQHFGLEAAQVVLGHSKADVTQIYAERDLSRAVEVARRIG